jgi:hypothetical protein
MSAEGSELVVSCICHEKVSKYWSSSGGGGGSSGGGGGAREPAEGPLVGMKTETFLLHFSIQLQWMQRCPSLFAATANMSPLAASGPGRATGGVFGSAARRAGPEPQR